jgi:hypothetical protein
MWEHGMPGSAWSMAADLLRWEELRDDPEDDLALAADLNAVEESRLARAWLPGNRWWGRRFALAGAVLRGS